MKNGKTQFVAILLSAVIAFTFGFGGGIASNYLVENNILNLSFNADEEERSFEDRKGARQEDAKELPAASDSGSSINISVSDDSSIGEAIAAKVLPSVVGISTTFTTTTYGDSFGFFGFGGGGYSYDSQGVGTGVIVDEAGYVLTNSHVVNDGDYKAISVSLYDGSEVEGTVLWNDSTLDLAIVKIEAEGLKAAELGDSDELQVGSYAAAIGNPLGLAFERSMSQGIISGLNRSITVSGNSGSTVTMEGLIQTDATINSGNSGGPLLNSKGQVVGINSAKAADGEGLGFAIPINTAKPIIQQIKDTGHFEKAYIGITGIGLEEQTNYTEEQLQEYFGTTEGVYVINVSVGGGADEAGIEKDDIILTVDGTEVSTMNKINTLLISHVAGDTVELEVLRDGKTRTVTVTLTNSMALQNSKQQ